VKIIPSSTDNAVQVNTGKKTISLRDTSISTTNTTNRLNLRGQAAVENNVPTSNAIAFTTKGTGKVYIYALSTNTENPRNLTVSDGTNVKEFSVSKGGSTAADEVVVDVQADTTYYVYSGDGGLGIYYIGSTVEFGDQTLTTDETDIVKAASNKVAYIKVGEKVYAIAIIPKTQIDNADVTAFYVSDGDANKSEELSTVYSTIQIGGKEYTAEDFSSDSNSDLLYGFEATNGGDDAKAIIANAVVNYNTAE
jgi:hypothetical protein